MDDSTDDEPNQLFGVDGIPVPYLAIGALVVAAFIFLVGAAI